MPKCCVQHSSMHIRCVTGTGTWRSGPCSFARNHRFPRAFSRLFGTPCNHMVLPGKELGSGLLLIHFPDLMCAWIPLIISLNHGIRLISYVICFFFSRSSIEWLDACPSSYPVRHGWTRFLVNHSLMTTIRRQVKTMINLLLKNCVHPTTLLPLTLTTTHPWIPKHL